MNISYDIIPLNLTIKIISFIKSKRFLFKKNPSSSPTTKTTQMLSSPAPLMGSILFKILSNDFVRNKSLCNQKYTNTATKTEGDEDYFQQRKIL